MNGFLIDTNVVSEYTKPTPENRVMQWFRPVDPRLLFASVVTLGEIRIGIDNLAPGHRPAALEAWLQTGLPSWFAPNLLPISPSIADGWAA